jgi:predicted SprT family Zn-dependent metalloprotease
MPKKAGENSPSVRVSVLAGNLFAEHELTNWSFEISNEKRAVGRCYHGRKKIVFSRHFLHIPWEQIEDTILHEIAHALVGSGNGHNEVWKRKAKEIGASDKRCAPLGVKASAKYNYVIKCPECDNKWYRYRMRERNFRAECPSCRVQVKIYRIH